MYFALKTLEQSRRLRKKWEDEVKRIVSKWPDRKDVWATISGIEIKRLYTPEDVRGLDFQNDIGYPGRFPLLRGNHATGYRGKPWTIRMFSGMGTSRDTNAWWRMLLKQGNTGLSAAFDYPTLMGYDSDSPRSRGECGRCGAIIDTIEDMRVLLDGIPVDRLSISFTINPPATVIWAMYCACAEQAGVALNRLAGTIQNDMLKEFIAQKTLMCPIDPSLKLIADTLEFGVKSVPRWNTISVCGYHIREAGSTAVQELAFALGNAIAYVNEIRERTGLEIDSFAPRLSFFFSVHIDFFEEIAKLRAARRIWARLMRNRFKAENPRSWWMRFHTQTAGSSLTSEQFYNNITRTALEALAAVLGGTQSLHTSSLTEVLCLPSDFTVRIALRTQQIIAEETGAGNTIDPLAGSYFIEGLTNEIEERVMEYLEKIDRLGGMKAAIQSGYPQGEIADAAYAYQKDIDSGKRVLVGVNKYAVSTRNTIPFPDFDEQVELDQIKSLKELRRKRNGRLVARSLAEIRNACRSGSNVMPSCIEAVKNMATLQEICDIYREVFG
ncbi:MAG: methylmalonyl-CoA mutase family protein, partial [Syntrophaceae bacterium]